MPASGKPDLSRRFLELACSILDFEPGQLLRRCYSPAQTDSNDFHLALRIAVAVTAFVLDVETLDHIIAESQVQLISLASIAQVAASLEDCSFLPALLPEFCAQLAPQVGVQALQFLQWKLADAHQHRTRMVLDYVADQNTEGRKRTGIRRYNHPGNPQSLRQFTGMHAPGAAERHQRKLPRIVTALNRDHADGFFHVGIDYTDDSGGKPLHGQAAAATL